ncbi:MAG: NADP-dependent malic enzyme [Candidatus Nanoarchaeia archaeon]
MSEALRLHRKLKGKISTESKTKIKNNKILALAYTPGVADACLAIKKDKEEARSLTINGNTVAVLSDGSAVLGLGNIGPEAALPVMEGKAILFKEFADVNAFPICINTQYPKEIIKLARNIAPTFAGINLEDIKAPGCFEIEDALQDLGIPVFHDDQHGTAIVVIAALMNAVKATNKTWEDLTVAINGAGAAGTAIAKMLLCLDAGHYCKSVKEVLICDSKGIINKKRNDLEKHKYLLARMSNRQNLRGDLKTAMKNADVFIGVSRGNIVTKAMVKSMAKDPIVFAMANPIPEIMPDKAKEGGAIIVATGRSDFPNQVNNVLAFPGVFKGALEARAERITPKMKVAAAHALADMVKKPTTENILPKPFNKNVAKNIAKAVKDAST